MKKQICSIFMMLFAVSAFASNGLEETKKVEKDTTFGYFFKSVKDIPCTAPKDQGSSGTCWSFSGLGFLESEVILNGKKPVDLAPMWIVRFTYLEKAIKYVRMHGKVNFSAGGATHDVLNVVEKYGIVPESVYTGLSYGTDKHQHGELDAVLTAYVEAVVKNANKTLSNAWIDGFNGILDAYLGELPESFQYDCADYTPKKFAEYLGLDTENYVSITSYNHQPFYSQYAIEVPDNWAAGLSYNLPLGEFLEVFENSVMEGYSILWASDVSEVGFDYNKGYAIVSDDAAPEDLTGTELSKWVAINAKKIKERVGPGKEKTITQELRQEAFDTYKTTDDHGMQIVGLATDLNGAKYYKVKNSWGTNHIYKGYFYASVPFVAYKTMNIVVNKKGIPKSIRKKLNID